MKYMIFGIFISLLSIASVAETIPEVDKSVIEFSNSMGINNIIDATMQQTRESLKTAMVDLSSNLRAQYPNLSDEQHKVLDKILNNYVDSVIDSIDANKASYIYTSVIAEGMTKNEIEAATKYYTSPEGQNLLKVIGTASAELNNYMLGTITESAKIAQSQLVKDLADFKSNLSETASK